MLGNKRNNSFSDSDKFSNMKLKSETYGLERTEYLACFKVRDKPLSRGRIFNVGVWGLFFFLQFVLDLGLGRGDLVDLEGWHGFSILSIMDLFPNLF